jgi:hypothetical protein
MMTSSSSGGPMTNIRKTAPQQAVLKNNLTSVLQARRG